MSQVILTNCSHCANSRVLLPFCDTQICTTSTATRRLRQEDVWSVMMIMGGDGFFITNMKN